MTPAQAAVAPDSLASRRPGGATAVLERLERGIYAATHDRAFPRNTRDVKNI
jgi:hypothetical protein